jgi:hypothetical protein
MSQKQNFLSVHEFYFFRIKAKSEFPILDKIGLMIEKYWKCFHYFILVFDE